MKKLEDFPLLHQTIGLAAVLAAVFVALGVASGAEPKLRYDVSARETEINLHGRVWLDATLTNQGEEPVVVYWGDRAYSKMYQLDIVDPEGRRTPAVDFAPRPTPLPVAAAHRYFRIIQPGKHVKYSFVLGNMPGGTQLVTFAKPGKYTIETSLHVATDHVMDPNIDDLPPMPNAWTGSLFGPSLTINVGKQVDPTAVAFSGKARIRGLVTDPQGNPLPNALVRSEVRIEGGGGYDGWSRTLGPRDMTDKDGRFEILRINENSPEFQLTVVHPRYPLKSVSITNHGKLEFKQDIQLDRGEAIRGNVVSQSGVAMRGVRVTGPHQDTALTDVRGEFSFPAAPISAEYAVDCYRPGFVQKYVKATRQQATDGSWTVELSRKSVLRGLALLPSGKPLRKARLEFKFRPAGKPNESPRGDRTETDAQGRFQIDLPSAKPLDIDALAEDGAVARHLPHDAWNAFVANVGPTNEEIVFEFDDSGELQIQVQPTEPLPAGVKLQVNVFRKNLDGHRMPFRSHTMPSQGGKANWTGVGPGEFVIETHVQDSTGWSWSQTADVPPGGQRKDVIFKLPKLAFGGLRGRVILPDGKPGPVRLWYDSSRGHGSIRSDNNGAFELPLVSAGRIWISSRNEEMVGKVAAEIAEGEVASIELHLQDRDKVTGIVKGKVRLPDGTPLVGVSTQSFHFGFSPKPDTPGQFETRLPIGKQWLTLYLDRSSVWMQATGRTLPTDRFRRSGLESITMQIMVAPRPNVHNITLPVDQLSDLTIGFRNHDPAKSWMVEVHSELVGKTGKMRYRREISWHGVPDGGESLADDNHPSQRVFRGIPRTKRRLIARQAGTFLWKKIEDGESKVMLDPSKTGRLEAVLLDADGTVMPNGAFRIEAAEIDETLFIWAPEQDTASNRPRQDKWVNVTAEGINQFSPFSEGRYRIAVARAYAGDRWKWNEPKEFDMLAGKTLSIRAQVQGDKIVWIDE